MLKGGGWCIRDQAWMGPAWCSIARFCCLWASLGGLKSGQWTGENHTDSTWSAAWPLDADRTLCPPCSSVEQRMSSLCLNIWGSSLAFESVFYNTSRQKFKEHDTKCGWPHPFGCTSDVQLHQHGMATSAAGGESNNVRETVRLCSLTRTGPGWELCIEIMRGKKAATSAS